MKTIKIISVTLLISLVGYSQDIATARSQGVGSTVTVTGIVTNGDELGPIRYIEDATAGIAIYDPTVICVEILGYRLLDNHEREIKIKNSKIYNFLTSKKYKKVWSGPNFCSHIFVKNN